MLVLIASFLEDIIDKVKYFKKEPMKDPDSVSNQYFPDWPTGHSIQMGTGSAGTITTANLGDNKGSYRILRSL